MSDDDDFVFINRVKITHDDGRLRVYIRRLGQWFTIFDKDDSFEDEVIVTVPMIKSAL